MAKKGNPLNGTGQRLWKRARKIIPGGNQLLSKRSERFLPEFWPAYYSKAKGAYVWDLDGRKYLDMSIMGVGCNVLGYADKDVDRAAKDAIDRSSMCTLNTPQEIELAELLVKLHPWADMCRFARTGGEAMAVAARIARAYTGRDVIAICGYHGWADWYLATNLAKKDALAQHLLSGLKPRGVPKTLRGTVYPFHYNRIDELKKILKKHPKLAAIIMEPVHGEAPKGNFLKQVRVLAKKSGAVFIFDEITIGWRLAVGGAHLQLDVKPDMAIFAKGMSNGYPMAAIIGTRNIMQAAQDTFISSTYWTDRIGPAATIASIKKMQRVNLPKRLARIGAQVKKVWEENAEKHGIHVEISGFLPLLFFKFPGKDREAVKTLFVQEMLKRGILSSDQFYASYAHTDAHVRQYARALDEVFAVIGKALREGKVRRLLKGPVASSNFQRLN
jgi:glutamate-1-semialdehyde aminotransferase